MNSYEKLMQEASQGNKKAFKELYSYAGSGNAEAQYFLALYYKGVGQDSDYAYWMNKSKDNGYDAAQNSPIPESKSEETEEKLPTSGEIQSVASDKISHSRVC